VSTLTVHYQWEDETVTESTGHPPSYAKAKKMKSLTLHLVLGQNGSGQNGTD